MSHKPLFLIGFSFTGKSAVGKMIASQLGAAYVDTDQEIVARAKKSISAIFAEDGEKQFRALENQILQDLRERQDIVIATGGGTVLDPTNRAFMVGQGVVICLEAKPETIYDRLRNQEVADPEGPGRPLLAGPNPLEKIRDLKDQRQALYAISNWTIHTDSLSEEEVAKEVLRATDILATHPQRGAPVSRSQPIRHHTIDAHQDTTFLVNTTASNYRVVVGWGILNELGKHVKDSQVGGKAFIISDSTVLSHYGKITRQSLEDSGLEVAHYAIPPTEESKTLTWARRLYQWLVREKAERRHVIIALGGGVVGDLAGFVAATFARGLPLVHVPTTLLAMVDASIGGKVAVNLPQGKNLIGAFHQPKLVLMDVQTLTSLPKRELTSGWAEVLKHALTLDPKLLQDMEEHTERLVALDRELSPMIIARSASLKAGVVSEDEKETKGKRIILNYGHTIGHALETATGYEQLLHGEAVAIGMMGAAMLGQMLGITPSTLVDQQQALLESYGLPTSYEGANVSAVERAISIDKKTLESTLQWVLLQNIGTTTINRNVPIDTVRHVLHKLAT